MKILKYGYLNKFMCNKIYSLLQWGNYETLDIFITNFFIC